MTPELPAEVVEFGVAARGAFDAAGGVELAREAETDPSVRERVVAPILDALGIADLDPRTDLEVAGAAGELCRVAGSCALPWPVAGALSVPAGRGRFLALVPPTARPRVDHGDLDGWVVADLDATTQVADGPGRRLGTRLGPWVSDVVLGSPAEPVDTIDVAWLLALGAWTLLGAAEAARAAAVEHVSSRVQFGQPLSEFQSVRFAIAEVAVREAGLRELCRYTTWRLHTTDERDALVDALALRTSALETARENFRVAHQLHGAIGFCDETDLSVFTRLAEPLLRLPTDLEATTDLLDHAIAQQGFAALFTSAR